MGSMWPDCMLEMAQSSYNAPGKLFKLLHTYNQGYSNVRRGHGSMSDETFSVELVLDSCKVAGRFRVNSPLCRSLSSYP